MSSLKRIIGVFSLKFRQQQARLIVKSRMATEDNHPPWSKRMELPASLPVPTDDGACAHLFNHPMPSLQLQATDGQVVDLSKASGLTVVYCYPRTGQHDQGIPQGWDDIPGARGCTPQSCEFRNHWEELKKLGVEHLYGLSTQDTHFQKEMVARLHLPFTVLSDAQFQLIEALSLPTFEFEGFGRLVKRLTFVVERGVIRKVFYPVFPPDKSAEEVIHWLRSK